MLLPSQTTFCDVVSRNFRDLASKIDRFSNELKLTNENLGKLHNEVMNSKHVPIVSLSKYITIYYNSTQR